MVGAALKKYAKEHNLKCDGGFAYGEVHGYAISMDDGADLKRLFIHTRLSEPEKKAELETMLGTSDLYANYRVQSNQVRESFILFIFHDKIGTMGLIEKFIDWLLPQLPQYGATGADICTECGTPMNGQGKWVLMDGIVQHMHESCLRSRSEAIRAQEGAAKENAEGSYLTGAIGALIGGLLGAVVWGFILNFGWMAGVVGLLIGFLAEKGYTILKGKLGKGKLFILIAVILVSVAAGTIFGEYLGLVREIKQEVYTGSYSATEYLLLLIKENPEIQSAVRSDLISNGVLGLIFAGLGAFGILRKTGVEVADTKIKELK